MNTEPIDYSSLLKDDLLKLVEDRQTQGVTSHANKADLIAALELQDEANRQEEAGRDLPDAPRQADVPEGDVVKSNPPKNTDFDMDKLYVMKEGHHVGEEFVLAVHEPDSYERTHSLKNKEHFWQGNEKQFRQAFEKK